MDAASPEFSKSARIVRWVRSCRTACFQGSGLLAGLLTAVVCLYWLHLLLATWGLTGFTFLSLGLATGLAILASRTEFPAPLKLAGFAGVLLLTVSSAWWWGSWDAWLARGFRAGTVGPEISALLNGILLGSQLLVLSWSAAWGGYSRRSSEIQRSTDSAGLNSRWWCGVAVGIWLMVAGLAIFVPVYSLAVTAAALLLASGIWQIVFRKEQSSAAAMTGSTAVDSTGIESVGLTNPPLWFSSLLAVVCGGLIPVVYRVLCQLQAETTLVFYGAIAGFCLGMAASRGKISWRAMFTVSIGLVLVLALFPLWLRGYLAISATVSAIPVSILLRQLGVVAFFLPVGFLTGNLVPLLASRRASGVGPLLCGYAAGVTGIWLASTLLLSWGTATVLLGLCLLLFGLLVWEINRSTGDFRPARLKSSRSQLLACGLAVAGLVCLPWSYQPEFAARALFSTHIFHAWRNGTALNTIAGLDDGRLLGVQESTSGTFTFWRHQGIHYQIRQNGIPAGRISGQETLVPQPSGGVLSAVLPLSMHAAPRQVLVLGLESGLPLKTVLEFPVMQVTCVENNSGLIEQAQQGVLAKTLQHVWADDRLQLLQQSTPVALRTTRQKYDVILESPGHSAVYRNAFQFDQQHYRWVAACLSDKGIYCQRFTFTDYGPAVLASLTETLQQTFGYVTVFDTAPGEMLFVAARQQDDILSAGLPERISAPQSRRNLAKIGWDWSVAMNLARFEQQQMADTRSYGLQNCWQGTGSFRLATEMMRWGNKWGEVRDLLARQPQRLLEHYPEEKLTEEALRRLSDVATREQDLAKHPDQFWVYRKSLKTRLTDNPRSVIEPVKGEGLQQKMHPEDRRRLDYFETLGQASQQNPCTLESLAILEEYAAPFDPLISYYLHPEIAKLYERCRPAQPDLELKHWLHSLYFGSQQERSVRSIHRSLTLLSSAETTLTEAERYDQINTLLELLKIRWQMRRGHQDITQPVLLLDLKDSLDSSQQALTAMQEFGKVAGISDEQTRIRVAELERSLVRMLKSYRVELLAKASKPSYPLPTASTAE